MGSDDKKRLKEQAKAEKKLAKARAKALKKGEIQPEQAKETQKKEKSSFMVNFAQGVRGVLFLVLSISLVVAVILSNKGYIITLDEIFDSLVAVWIGKIVLLVVSVAFFVLGLKQLRAIK